MREHVDKQRQVFRILVETDKHFERAGIDTEAQSGYCAAFLSDVCSLSDRQRFGLIAGVLPVTHEIWSEVVLVYQRRYGAHLRKVEPPARDEKGRSA